MNIQMFDVRTYVMETTAAGPQQSLVENVQASLYSAMDRVFTRFGH